MQKNRQSCQNGCNEMGKQKKKRKENAKTNSQQ